VQPPQSLTDSATLFGLITPQVEWITRGLPLNLGVVSSERISVRVASPSTASAILPSVTGEMIVMDSDGMAVLMESLRDLKDQVKKLDEKIDRVDEKLTDVRDRALHLRWMVGIAIAIGLIALGKQFWPYIVAAFPK